MKRLTVAAVLLVVLATGGYFIARRELSPAFIPGAQRVTFSAGGGSTHTVVDEIRVGDLPLDAHLASIDQAGLPSGVTETVIAVMPGTTTTSGVRAGDIRNMVGAYLTPISEISLKAHASTWIARIVTVDRITHTVALGLLTVTWRAGIFTGRADVGSRITVVPLG